MDKVIGFKKDIKEYKMSPKISVVIITKNEEKNIGKCLESIKWVDEIIVIDDCSSDKTVEICKKYTNKVFRKKWLGYSGQKKFGFKKASNEWILNLDADEQISEKLQKEIKEILKTNKSDKAFYIPYYNYFLGKRIMGCGWYPDYHLRLFRNKKWEMKRMEIHESISVKGEKKYLKNPIIHCSYINISHYLEKLNRYTSLEAQTIKNIKNRRKLVYLMLAKPLKTFKKMYIKQKGYKEGMHGFILSVFSSIYRFMVYAKYWELRENKEI